MMVSEQTHALPLSKPMSIDNSNTSTGGAIAFPPSLLNEMTVLENMVTTTPTLSDETSTLPFDEQLIGLQSDTAYAEAMTAILGSMGSTSTTSTTTTTSSEPFVVDTAALAQQIAGLIQDEKKLPDVRIHCRF